MTSLLGIYLNDHVAGASAGAELAKRAAEAQRGAPAGKDLTWIAREIDEDRHALLEVMRSLEVPVRHYKVYAGWVAEKVGRLKLNGHLIERSPLSDLLELEGLRLGVEGKLALWRTLQELTNSEPRLKAVDLDDLVARAQRQIASLEAQRLACGARVLVESF